MCSASTAALSRLALSSWVLSAVWASGVRVAFGVRRQTTTSANTTASNPITMNASDNPLLTATPFRP
jgi:hypothetical protein